MEEIFPIVQEHDKTVGIVAEKLMLHSRYRNKQPVRQRSFNWLVLLGALVAVNLYVFVLREDTSVPAVMKAAALANPSAKAASQRGHSVAGAKAVDPDESLWKSGTVRSGDSLARILGRIGVAPNGVDQILRAMQPHLDFRSIRKGQRYRFRRDQDHKVNGFELRVSRLIAVRAERDGDSGGFKGRKVITKTAVQVFEIAGTVESSLYNSVRDLGEDPVLAGKIVDVFAYDLEFYLEAQKGDQFRLIVEKEYVDNDFLRYRRILAAEYRSQTTGTHRAFYWRKPGQDEWRYYDEKGNSVTRTLLKSPLKHRRVTSKFSKSRIHPVLKKPRPHLGVDYAAPEGTPVRAVASGKIIYRKRRGGAGNVVIIRHPGGLVTEYMHLSRFRSGHRVGKTVAQKEVIGYVGATGLVTGAHLHFGMKYKGKYVDPLRMKTTRPERIAQKYLGKFRRRVDQLRARLSAIPEGTAKVRKVALAPGSKSTGPR